MLRYLRIITAIFIVLNFVLVVPTPRKVRSQSEAYHLIELTVGGSGSQGTAINASGQVVGWGETASGEHHAFIFDDTGMRDLGTLGGSVAEANDINDVGQVVGTSDLSESGTNAFMFDITNGLRDIGSSDTGYDIATDINNNGQVTGISFITVERPSGIPTGAQVGFIYDSDNGMRLIPLLGISTISAPGANVSGINDNGQIVGGSTTTDNSFHAFLYDTTNGLRDLGTLGGNHSIATSINNAGQIVGISKTGISLEEHAFIFDELNGMHDLGTFGGSYSRAIHINDSGQVVGVAETSSGVWHGFLYDSVNGMRDLGIPSGGISVEPTYINNFGQIIGTYQPESGNWRPFIYDEINGFRDINSLIANETVWEVNQVTRINDAGQIV